uniref:Splicing factor 45 n=1 Tax=Daphnia pulicaria TaxID=35523 RepID=A0A4Y7MYB0_9CRUS|nr:EOG090X0BIL [Daphnia pulicaria]
MSLYDDIDENKAKSVTGWSSGIKLLHSQMHLKKAMITQPKREGIRRAIHPVIPPCLTATESQIKTEPEMTKNLIHQTPQLLATIVPKQERSSLFAELEWDPNLEYDPLHPTDYDKIIRERKERRGIEIEIEEAEKKRKPRDDRDIKTRDRSSSAAGSGFAGRLHDEEEEPMVKKSSTSGGVAIAPPPSLQDTSSPSHPSLSTGSGVGALGVAAKIMAKYGFKEGQGLGRQQQGIAAALQVEKTSKRGGRIINEKEIMPPPPPVVSPTAAPKAELTIADIMKNPSKVIYLRNMVGPGEVDSDLEPEVREECQTKYGDVNKVVIFEVPNAEEEEAVRIFVEFKRMEAAIKAVIDLNGRFFAGRQVKAGFYDVERFLKMELND